MHKILISYFLPFDQQALNSSQILCGELEQQFPQVTFVSLPVSYEKSWQKLSEKIEIEKPNIVLSLGQAEGRPIINLEKIAVNYAHSKLADNDNLVLLDHKIDPEGPPAFFTTIDLLILTDKINHEKLAISPSAGSYVCNYLYYKTLSQFSKTGQQALFIHLPILPEQIRKDNCPSMDQYTMVQILGKIITNL